jgi:PAS domain S-box-containing protein
MNLESQIHERRGAEQTLRENEAWLAGQREALEAALNNAPLETSLGVLVRTATDRLGQGTRAAFYLANCECTALHHVVGMPADYANAVDGFKISAESLSCGLAMHTGLPVLTSDVDKEPLWVPWLWMAQKADFRGCWSFPIRTTAGTFVGTFAVYWRQPREATPQDLELAALVTQAAAIIIARHTDIEMRREAEDALRESEQRLKLFIEHAPVAIAMFDRAMRYISASRRWLDDYGVTGDVIGRSHYEVFPEIPEHWREVHRRGLAGETLHSEGDRFDRADGSVQWVKWDVRPWRTTLGEISGTLIATEEITALRASEERLRLAMGAGDMGAWDIDLKTGAIVWDAKQYQIFGRPHDHPPLTMEEFYALVHPDDVVRIKGAAACAEHTRRFHEEFRIIRADGSVRWIKGLGTTLTDQNDRPVRMVGVNYDTTERKEAQFRLERFAEELERLVTARTAELLESEVQLRSLATELNLAEQRERRRLATELHDHLQQMLVLASMKLGMAKQLGETPAAARAMKEIDEVLSEALQYTRTLVADLSPTALHEHGLAAGLRWLADYMKKYHMTVSITVPEQEVNLPEDQCTLLFQSVRELLINSSKHARTGEAAVNMTLDDGRIEIMVSDTGPGCDLASINTVADNPGGLSSKFGLFSIRERMRALGGSFDLKSSPGQGTVATLILSLKSHKVGTEKIAPHTSYVQGRTAFPLGPVGKDTSDGKIHVLLVDDHAMVRQGLRSVLDSYPKIKVVGEASNGKEALVAVKTLRPHVVVMDVNMPNMSGIDATTAIKALDPDVVIVGLSVNAGDENRQAMLGAGASVLLTKEAAVESLYHAIGEAVGLRR